MDEITQNPRIRAIVVLIGALLTMAAIAPAADKAVSDEEGEESVFEVDPEGTPRGYDARPERPTYYIWRDGDTWHLRTKTMRHSRQFSGTIRVEGGTVTKIFNYGGLERGGRRRVQDIGRLNEAKNQIDFKFVTTGREDGFDFKLSRRASTLGFALKLDGYEHRGNILIGREASNPPKANFLLQARATEPPKETPDSTKDE